MKKILVVFTGGTIGSRIHNTTIDVDDGTGYELIKKLQENYSYEVTFDTVQPLNILSENATPGLWKIIHDAIRRADLAHYDGVIVTHGSDTLSYTSAALSFLLQDTRIPITITASNYAQECEKSNGFDNFKSCVELIMNSPMPGIFTVFQDDKGKNKVYLASRIMEAESYNDQFFGYGGAEFGEIRDGVFQPVISKINPEPAILSRPRERVLGDSIEFSRPILALRPYPGLNYDFIRLEHKPGAVLHSLYHSGTGCINEDGYSLPHFIKRCREEGIEVYLISFRDIERELYKTSREILKYGAVPLQNISFEAAYAKLCIAYNQTVLPPREYVEKEQFFEFLPR